MDIRLRMLGLGALRLFDALLFFQSFRGFVPGRRVPFGSAKGTKTIAAAAGFLGGEGCNPVKSGPTRSAQTRAARDKSVPPWGQPAGVLSTVRLLSCASVRVADWQVEGRGDRFSFLLTTE